MPKYEFCEVKWISNNDRPGFWGFQMFATPTNYHGWVSKQSQDGQDAVSLMGKDGWSIAHIHEPAKEDRDQHVIYTMQRQITEKS